MTPAEGLLWEHIRSGRLCGAKFRRQHFIAGYIVDFYCPASRLVIEVDGEIHLSQRDADAVREAALSAYGVRVTRFSNTAVLHDIAGVLHVIAAALTPQPPLPEGEGE
jgi:very-short-patch-repair endonuclease